MNTANLDMAHDPLPDSNRTVGLVSAAHFLSHYYMLALPPLFPLLRDVYGVGFTELGFALTVYSATTALTQAPMGFLVDRHGPGTLLIAGLVLEAIAIGLVAVLPGYGSLVAMMALAGLANAVFHPADYSILNAAVDPARMGRAFSIHTFAGFLGNAVAPVGVLFVAAWLGWQAALLISAVVGLAVAALIASQRALLSVSPPPPAPGDEGVAPGRSGLALLLSAPVLMGFAFFVGLSVAGRGVGSFGVAVLDQAFALPLATAGAVLSAYLFAAPVGVLWGGWVADRTQHHGRFAAACLVVSGAALLLLVALGPGLAGIAVALAVAGFAWGAVAPSRDMLVRALAPPGEMGKVFGFVSTGFNVGGVLAPPVFGYLLDHADPAIVFQVAGVVSLVTVATVVGRRSGSERPDPET